MAGAAADSADCALSDFATPAGRLTRHHRLIHQMALQRVLRKGRRAHGPHLLLTSAWQPRDGANRPGLRLGLAVSKGVGNAPQRARMRRLLREAFRALRSSWPAGQDVVISARTPWPDAGLTAVVAELAALATQVMAPARSGRAPRTERR